MKTYTIALVSKDGWRNEVVKAASAVDAIAAVKKDGESARIIHTSKK